MATRYAIVAEKSGEKINLFKDNRTYKTEKYAKYLLPRFQMQFTENLFIIPVEQLSDQEKLTKAWNDLDLTWFAIGELYGNDGIQKIKDLIEKQKVKPNE